MFYCQAPADRTARVLHVENKPGRAELLDESIDDLGEAVVVGRRFVSGRRVAVTHPGMVRRQDSTAEQCGSPDLHRCRNAQYGAVEHASDE
jgi:hypothetical protein